jgi:hypothetical protein
LAGGGERLPQSANLGGLPHNLVLGGNAMGLRGAGDLLQTLLDLVQE